MVLTWIHRASGMIAIVAMIAAFWLVSPDNTVTSMIAAVTAVIALLVMVGTLVIRQWRTPIQDLPEHDVIRVVRRHIKALALMGVVSIAAGLGLASYSPSPGWMGPVISGFIVSMTILLTAYAVIRSVMRDIAKLRQEQIHFRARPFRWLLGVSVVFYTLMASAMVGIIFILDQFSV